MACECLSKIDAKLAPEHKLEIALRYAGGTLTAAPYSRILRKDNGRPETRRGKPSIFGFTYCPFCGERYEPAPAVPAATGAGA